MKDALCSFVLLAYESLKASPYSIDIFYQVVTVHDRVLEQILVVLV